MYNALRLSQKFVIWLAVGAVCAGGCYRPRLWVAPEYWGPKPTATAWPHHACRVCGSPACFGYHPGQWRPWPCPDEPSAAGIGLNSQVPDSAATEHPAAPDRVPPAPPSQTDAVAPLPENRPIPEMTPNPAEGELESPKVAPSPSDALPIPAEKKTGPAAAPVPQTPPKAPALKLDPTDSSALPSDDLFSAMVQAVHVLSSQTVASQRCEPVVPAMFATPGRSNEPTGTAKLVSTFSLSRPGFRN